MTRPAFGLLKETYDRFNADKVPRLAAALSYTTIFAIAPVFIVIIAIAGYVVGVANGTGHGHHVVEDRMLAAIQSSAGKEAADTVRQLVTSAFAKPRQSVVAQIVGWITLLLGAIGLFAALQDSLNTIWDAHPPQRGIWLAIRSRLASFGMLLGIVFLLLVTSVVNAGIAIVVTRLVALLPFPGAGALLTVVNLVVSIALIALLFAAMYKVLPDVEIAWGDVRIGAIVTAALFVVGQSLIGLYLSWAGVASGYGAAGSLLVLLLWIYYSSLVLLVGAEFTHVYALRHGSHRENAMSAPLGSRSPAASATTSRTAAPGGTATTIQ
ncbi:MAG TPA: YihY/virulence factor BrkB family protein [Candidatus Elarobacter sp.]|jgi:membrane protein